MSNYHSLVFDEKAPVILTPDDIYRLRLENSLAAAAQRAKVAEEVLREKEAAHALVTKELTTQIGSLTEALKGLPRLEALLEQKNAALMALSIRLRELENELAEYEEDS